MTVDVSKPKEKGQYRPFRATWRLSPRKRRVVNHRLLTDVTDIPLFKEFLRRWAPTVDNLIRSTLDRIKDGTYPEDAFERKELHRAIQRDEAKYLKSDEVDFQLERLRRSACMKAWEMLRAVYKRFNNKVPDSPPRLRNSKTVSLKDGAVTDLSLRKKEGEKGFRKSAPPKNAFVFTLHGALKVDGKRCNDPKVEIPYEVMKGSHKNKKWMERGFGCNLKFKDGHWVVAAAAWIPFKWSYVPTASLGFDLNETPEDFITFSDGAVFAADDRLLRCIARLDDLNAQLRDKTRKFIKNSSERSAVRHKVFLAHRRLRRLCQAYCQRIIDKAVAAKAVLCIDDLSLKSGSFGQEHIIDTLQQMCEDAGIPFVLMPTYHTSKMHNGCKRWAERPTTAQGVCSHCGVTYDAQLNAAKNIADGGWKIWCEGIGSFWKWYREEYKPTVPKETKKKGKKAGVQPADNTDVPWDKPEVCTAA